MGVVERNRTAKHDKKCIVSCFQPSVIETRPVVSISHVTKTLGDIPETPSLKKTLQENYTTSKPSA